MKKLSDISARFRYHITNPNSHHRRIFISFLWVSFFVFAGKLAGALKEIAIAWRYGVSETVDAYVFIFNIVMWPVSVWFSILSVVLIPLIAKVREENPNTLPRFSGELLGVTLAFGGLFAGAIYWVLLGALNAGWTGLSGATLQKALEMVGYLVLLLPLGFGIGTFSSWMMAYGWHRNTLLESVPATVILLMVILPSNWIAHPLVVGSLLGVILQLLWLSFPLWMRGEFGFIRLGFQSSAWQYFWGSIGIMAVGQTIMSSSSIIDQFFAAHLGNGAISTLNYANRIMALVLGLGATAISRSVLPVFSEGHAKNNQTARSYALQWAGWMFYLGATLLIAGWQFAPLLVRLIFERGEFSSNDTQVVGVVLQYSLLQVPFYFSAIVLYSFFASERKYILLLLVMFFSVLAKILFLLIFVDLFGLLGLQASTAVLYLSFMFMLFGAVKIRGKSGAK